MLTATEQVRVKKFNQGRDADVAFAMEMLFSITKPGCDEHAYELFDAAHANTRVSDAAIAKFERYGIVFPNGAVPKGVSEAIRDAVAQHMLVMHYKVEHALHPGRDLH